MGNGYKYKRCFYYSVNGCLKIKPDDYFSLPHPSGRNRLLNDKKYIKLKLKECKEWLND